MATGIAVRRRRDARCRQTECTGKRLSRTLWSSFKEKMSHLCDSTVAGLTARRDNVLASKCEYPPFRYPPFKCALNYQDGAGTEPEPETGTVGTVFHPDPPTLAFLEKARAFPHKARVFLFAEPLKSMEKKGKTHKKAREIGKQKEQGNRKKQGLEGQGRNRNRNRNRRNRFSGTGTGPPSP